MPGPLYHSAPNAFAMRAGRVAEVMVLMPRFDPVALLELIERERLDTMFMVPTMFIRLFKLPEEVRRKFDLSSLRFVIHAAAPCPPDVKRAMIEWWGPVINEFYGSTEFERGDAATSADTLARPGTVGRVVEGAELRILDDEGASCRRARSARSSRASPSCRTSPITTSRPSAPAIDRDGFITSGDVGYLDERRLSLPVRSQARHGDLGRRQYLSGRDRGGAAWPCPASRIAPCSASPTPSSARRLMAVVEPADGAALSADAVRAYLRRHLADYKVPRTIEIGRDLPREDSGKIFKRRLRDPYWQKEGRRI